MKSSLKKIFFICTLPLLLTACNGDDGESKSSVDNAALASKSTLEGTWSYTVTHTEKGITQNITHTMEFTGLRLVKKYDSEGSNGDNFHIITTNTFSIGHEDQDSTEIDVSKKQSTISLVTNGHKSTHSYSSESKNGKPDLGIFKIEGNKLEWLIDDNYEQDNGRTESVRPVYLNTGYEVFTRT